MYRKSNFLNISKIVICILFLIPIWKNATAQTESDYILLEKEVEKKIRSELATLDSIRMQAEYLEKKNQRIYTDLIILEAALQSKLQESFLLREEIVEAQSMYQDQQAHYHRLLKKYHHLANHRKPKKIIVVRNRYILQRQDQKVFSVLMLTGIIFAGAGILIARVTN